MITSMCRQKTEKAGDYHDYVVITNRKLCSIPLTDQLRRVLPLHPEAVILREKDLTDMEYRELAAKVQSICKEEGVILFLHSRDQIARELGIRCLHLSISELRRLLANAQTLDGFDEISVSCHSVEDMQEAVTGGATRIILGTIFETDCKPGLIGRGLAFVEEVCRQCPIPVYAIGGVKEERMPLLREAGAAGGCMMSGFMRM